MAVTLEAPRYSFVQIDEEEQNTGCAPVIPLCLPVVHSSDLQFQIIATVPKDDESWFEVEETVGPFTLKETIFARICFDCGIDGSAEDCASGHYPWIGNWKKIFDGGLEPSIWIGNFVPNIEYSLWDNIPVGRCFNICFNKIVYNVTDEIIGECDIEIIACSSVCFVKIADPCFTSRFEYTCNEDSFGFVYLDGIGGNIDFTNKIRLPCYLRDFQMPSEQKAYQKSDGVSIKLYERIDEDYELSIDWMYKQWHKKLKVLLAHDLITINNPNEAPTDDMFIVCEEKYECKWPEIPWQLAQAKTRVKRSEALSLLNSNCN